MKKIALFAGLSALALAGPALASPANQATNLAVRVNYTDLNLTQTQDAGQLLSRLRVATLRVCADRAETALTPADAREMRACRHDVMSAAVERIDSAEVTRLYNQARARQTASR